MRLMTRSWTLQPPHNRCLSLAPESPFVATQTAAFHPCNSQLLKQNWSCFDPALKPEPGWHSKYLKTLSERRRATELWAMSSASAAQGLGMFACTCYSPSLVFSLSSISFLDISPEALHSEVFPSTLSLSVPCNAAEMLFQAMAFDSGIQNDKPCSAGKFQQPFGTSSCHVRYSPSVLDGKLRSKIKISLYLVTRPLTGMGLSWAGNEWL